MPKEVILQHEPRFYDESGREIPQETQPLVQISWSREAEYVQMATGQRHPVTHESEQDKWWFVQLNRTMINDMIRVLRRARDQAFGRDE
jgi:hypothetical protein